MELKARTAVVTGAGSGIGRETALLCARRGAALAICDVNERGLEETAERIGALGAEVSPERVDVADADQMTAFAAHVQERFGGADLLVNNAGVAVVATFLETEPEDWHRLVGVNVMGVVNGCRSFVPQMIARGRGGHVVNLSSQAGFQASAALNAYSTTKFAVFGFSEALRAELKPHGIGVTAVCPGVVNTPITRSPVRGERPDERQDRFVRLYERRGYGPEKVALNILRAVERNRAVAPITPEAHFGYFVSRVAPPLSRWISEKLLGVAR